MNLLIPERESAASAGACSWRWPIDRAMKNLCILLLFMLLVSTNGCMTYSAVQRAKGEHNNVTGHSPVEPHPAYYALVPLTVPADIVTSPFQLIIYVALRSSSAPL